MTRRQANSVAFRMAACQQEAAAAAEHDGETEHAADHNNPPPPYITGDWYTLGQVRQAQAHDRLLHRRAHRDHVLHGHADRLVRAHLRLRLHARRAARRTPTTRCTLSNGEHLHRRGRFHRFFQYLSLFCFSMLGICIAGNLAMVFVFWELVGICSYFLIGFYIERHSASTAANKAFIVNRVGDFGMLIGMMAIWSSLGTFSFGDTRDADGNVEEPGIFSQLRDERESITARADRRHGRRRSPRRDRRSRAARR